MDKSPERNRSINWKLWLGLLISAISIYLAFRKIELVTLWKVISGCSIYYLLLAALINLFQLFIRAWRWKILLKPIKNTGFSNRLLSVLIGFAANCVLPARLGEFVRADQLGERENISKSSTFATIVVERLIDGFTLLLILFIGLMSVTFPEDMGSVSTGLKSAGITLFISYLLVIIFLVGFRLRPDRYLAIISKALFFLPVKLRLKSIDMVRNFGQGLTPIKGLSGWGLVIFYSLLLWASSLFQVLFIGHSIGLTLPFNGLFIILSMAVFGVMIPSAPGYIGTFHLAVQYGFILFGVSGEEGLSAAILYHASFFFPTILFGLIAYIIINRQR
ncbi:MAG: flippase-like domain-containing protein [Deltaproteobacteria bacterium]|nr:flippase-like domain-containing protein [Deltaproteobacteria bacterium]